MNEYSLLINVLSRSNTFDPVKIGATSLELCEMLGFSGKHRYTQLFLLLDRFNRSLIPFNLVVRQNPFNMYWFLTQNAEVEDIFDTNPFENQTRLGATLCSILIYCLTQKKPLSINELQQIRKKQSIHEDLQSLQSKHFINIENQLITIHSNLGYYLDLPHFLTLLDQKLLNSSTFSI